MYGFPKSEQFSFAPNLIGETLAYIVSELEGEAYVYASLEVYNHGWMQGCGVFVDYYDTKAIVRPEFTKCSFSLDDHSPWRLAKLAHVLDCTMHNSSHKVSYDAPVSFIQEFSSQNCAFPYLNDFLDILEEYKNENGEVTKEMAMALAVDFVAEKSRKVVKKELINKES